jgi:nucleoside-diphosphate-sugar epimerase
VRVLISGCGYIGSALGLLLAAQGHTAFGLRRNTRALPPAILPVQADLSASLPPDASPPNLDAVIYAAPPARSTDETYEAAYVDGPCNLLIGAFFRGLTVQICQRAGVTRIATE